jgi:ribosome biogenesis protein ERB1
VAPRNTIGEVPLKWYEDEPHIGYDIKGKKIKKKEKEDKLGSFLANVDDSKNWLVSYFIVSVFFCWTLNYQCPLLLKMKS